MTRDHAFGARHWAPGGRGLVSRLARSVIRLGVRGTFENAAALVEDALFDSMFGIETSAPVGLAGLRISSPNKLLGVSYVPTRARAFRKLMDRLDLPQGRVFVDFGCGKGRTLVMAAGYRFRRVVGVEFAPELCAICRRNIAAFQARGHAEAAFEIVEGDAASYRVRADEDVFFFFNPFRGPVMESVLRNIALSLEERPRRVWLIVNNPADLEATFRSRGWLTRIGEYAYGSSIFRIYSNERAGPLFKP
ncbi:class I SAM-dependent methyltransferase [Arenibaculum pallidiluteum]|uniref:class I SAM-dependent methyltransferase n=1 Tax=Arenibaculum pallidiluteum TaxID=2812559 RepID=UPI001A95ED7A|nr:class I SAM-dependent methyltransferase [Arenibaculum pallidiluteum]